MTKPRTAALLIGLLILALYGRTLGYGLVWDDYAAFRARPLAALLGAWAGPWDPGGVWPNFYRPLSIALYAVLYQVFDHNTVGLHAMNLVELFLAAWMLRAFVRRETDSNALGLAAAMALVLHPETPSSLAAWISQQFHLVELIAVVGAMLVWQRVRHRRPAAWVWVLAPLTLGVLIKEDVLMIVPALLTWQLIRARFVRDVPVPSRQVVLLLGGWAAAYLVWRTVALGAIGGYGTPAAGRLLLNTVSGPLFTFGLQWIPSAHGLSLVAGAGVALLAGFAWVGRREATPRLTSLVLYGVTLGVFANVPLLLVSGHTRVHLMTLAAVMTLTAAAGIAAAGVTARHGRVPLSAVAALLAWAIVVALANWTNTNTFAPCAAETLQRDADVLTWDVLTDTVRRELTAKMAACAQTGSEPFSTGFNR